jgi:multicomponent Na+:H+ antiporter subunit B
MISRYESVVVRLSCQLLVPFMQVFAVYVLFHGHYSPGGGFQAGAILAASIIVARLTQPPEVAQRYLPRSSAIRLGATGVFLYGSVGLLPLSCGGEFLDYGRLALGELMPARARYWGILAVEIGVGLAVCGAMVSIFDDLGRRGPERRR